MARAGQHADKANQRAGKNVRALALRRRTQAVLQFGKSGFLVLLPWGSAPIVRALSPRSTLPLWAYLLCFGAAVLPLLQGLHLWKRAGHADQGAKAEEEIAALLTPLQQQGWQIEYGVQDRQVGDVDVVLVAPSGKAFTIDVKSHRGEVVVKDQQLYRRRGQIEALFEKDFLKQAKRQAAVIARQKGLRFVQPLIVFSDARVNIRTNPIAGVQVVGKQDLLNCLQSLERP